MSGMKFLIQQQQDDIRNKKEENKYLQRTEKNVKKI